LNPRPKTIHNGFYMFIPNFNFHLSGLLRAGYLTAYPVSLTDYDTGTHKRLFRESTPFTEFAEGTQQDGSSSTLLRRNYNRLRLFCFRRLTSLRHSTCYHSFKNPRRSHFAPIFSKNLP